MNNTVRFLFAETGRYFDMQHILGHRRICCAGGDQMCRRTKLWGLLLCALGTGLLLSCLMEGVLLRLLLGAALLTAGVLLLSGR